LLLVQQDLSLTGGHNTDASDLGELVGEVSEVVNSSKKYRSTARR